MPVQLVALRDGPNILIDKPILLIGRHPECDIQIDSRKISRRHCVIAQVNDYLLVRDLDSTNGIRINGAKVVEGKLLPGDELTLGTFLFRVQVDAAGEVPAIVSEPAGGSRGGGEDEWEQADDPIPLIDRTKTRPQPRTEFREDSEPLG
ncbi:MAG: FHA domain-containing protein [Gemmataceae bacterium]